MDLKLCPRCKQLPTVKMHKRFLGYESAIYCNTLGCSLFWPVVCSGITEARAMNKAAMQWNQKVDDYLIKKGD